MRSHATGLLLIVAMAVLIATSQTGHSQEASPPDRALVEVFNKARELLLQDKPEEAAAALEAYKGPDHYERRMLMGHAYSQAGRFAPAQTAYRAALQMREDSKDAMKGIARACIAQEKWKEARKWLGAGLSLENDDANWISAYATVARHLSDTRLCRMIVDAGMLRFPEDMRLRRLDLALLLEADSPRAVASATYLLKRRPDDAEAWSWLARAHQQAGNMTDCRAALRAQMLLSPEPTPAAQRAYLQTCLADGDWLTVLDAGRDVLTKAKPDARPDAGLMETFVTAAEYGGEDDLVADWVGRLPEDERTPQMLTALARSAIRSGKDADALGALSKLIESGNADAAAYLNAAQAAERLGKTEEADALYQEAAQLPGDAAELAPLYRARLLFQQGRMDDASSLLKASLARNPLAAETRAFLRLVEERLRARQTD